MLRQAKRCGILPVLQRGWHPAVHRRDAGREKPRPGPPHDNVGIGLVKQIIYKLNEKGFNDDRYAETCCYSPQAVAEEIDFFLPKSFWSVKVRKSGSASQTYIDPDWPSFEKWGWNFEYPETKARLKAERESTLSRFSENHRKKVERDRLKGSSESNLPKFDPETGEIFEEEKQ